MPAEAKRFQQVDTVWRDNMTATSAEPACLAATERDGLLGRLRRGSRTPSVFKTDGTTEVVVSGTEFGTFDTHASFQIVFSKGVLRNNCDSTIDDVIAPGDCLFLVVKTSVHKCQQKPNDFNK